MFTSVHRKEPQAANKNNQPFFSPATIQPKLTIGQPNDKYEQEADAMADRVMRMPLSMGSFEGNPIDGGSHPVPTVQTKCATCEEKEKLQTKPLMMKSEGGGGVATQSLTSQLNSSKGGGSPLPFDTNNYMSQAFGSDFSGVRVHTGRNAIQMNQGLNARAFTHGSDVYFNQGQYSPSSSEGKKLLAHELTHVVQQGNRNKLVQLQAEEGGPYHPPEGIGLRCREGDSCSQISLKINYLRHTIQSHVEWDQLNPDSRYPDGRHADEISDLRRALERCIREAIRCRNQPRWVPIPETVPEIEENQRDTEEERRRIIKESPLPEWVKYALYGILGILTLTAIIATIACFASGACEIALVIAGLGTVAAAVILMILEQGGIRDNSEEIA